MKEQQQQQPKLDQKKSYTKPEVRKHKPVAAISGSGDSTDCYYASRTAFGGTYYL